MIIYESLMISALILKRTYDSRTGPVLILLMISTSSLSSKGIDNDLQLPVGSLMISVSSLLSKGIDNDLQLPVGSSMIPASSLSSKKKLKRCIIHKHKLRFLYH